MYDFATHPVPVDSFVGRGPAGDRTRPRAEPQTESRLAPQLDAAVKPGRWVQVNSQLAINLDHVAWIDWPEDGSAECVLYLATPGPGGARTYAIQRIDVAEDIHALLFPPT